MSRLFRLFLLSVWGKYSAKKLRFLQKPVSDVGVGIGVGMIFFPENYWKLSLAQRPRYLMIPLMTEGSSSPWFESLIRHFFLSRNLGHFFWSCLISLESSFFLNHRWYLPATISCRDNPFAILSSLFQYLLFMLSLPFSGVNFWGPILSSPGKEKKEHLL